MKNNPGSGKNAKGTSNQVVEARLNLATEQNQTNQTAMTGPSLMDLPSEIRLRILEFSSLVVRPLPNLDTDSLTIVEGECSISSKVGKCCGRCISGSCRCPYTQCACYVFSSALFYTCRQLSSEARKICFSVNRLRFLDTPGANLERVLKIQPEYLLQSIREIEYAFYEDDLVDECPNINSQFTKEWTDFIEFVAKNLNLSNLTFSIDASRPYLGWVTNNTTQDDLETLEVAAAFKNISKPLIKLEGLKNLFIYWPVFHSLEAKYEKTVMGDDYDAYEHGKVPLKGRAPGYPRGMNFPAKDIGTMGSYDAESEA